MAANTHRESAKIYMFPTGARATSADGLRKARFAAELATLRLSETVCGDNWYHDEAIRQEDTAVTH